MKISLYALVGEEPDNIEYFLNQYVPFFDDVVLVFDEATDKTKTIFEQWVQQQQELGSSVTEYVKVFTRPLNGDFATQTNYAIEQCSNDWVLKIDLDEKFSEFFLKSLPEIIENHTQKNPNIKVIGFARLNSLDGKIINDLPRDKWFTDVFNTYQFNGNLQNPDVQFRLHRKDVRWVNPVHEIPEPVAKRDSDSYVIEKHHHIYHPKSRERQLEQLRFYDKIMPRQKTDIKKIVYDSVIYTYEGITEHARKEAVELQKRGYQVLLLDNRYREGFEPELQTMYHPIDFTKNDYVTIVNQPPPRWNATKGYRNRIGYLAFEGQLPKDWVQQINSSDIIELWTPSTYCETLFKKSGVNKPLYVIPHGLNSIFIPNPNKNDVFTFFAMGTYHNDRKGLDLVAKAFSEEFKNENAQLVFKVNGIYNPNASFNTYINNHIDFDGNTNVTYVTDNLSEQELVDLFNQAHVFVSPHRSEGFGINILNAIGCGLPVVCTGETGNVDFTSRYDSILHVKSNGLRWTRFQPPYDRAKWEEPNLDDLKKQMRTAYNEYATLSEKAISNSVQAHKDYSWETIGNLIDTRIKTLFT